MTDFHLQITAGVGPTEARRFVSLLATHIERLAEQRGLAVHEVIHHGDEGAPRSVLLRLHGDVTAVAGELGTHLLVHRSERRGRSSRKRWFAAVTLHRPPAARADSAIAAIARDELVITACRASGPGGQHVNKVSSAVRVQHVPSGLCAAARSHARRRPTSITRCAAWSR